MGCQGPVLPHTEVQILVGKINRERWPAMWGSLMFTWSYKWSWQDCYKADGPVYFSCHNQLASPAGQAQAFCDSSHSACGTGRHCQVSLMWLSSFRPCQRQEAGRAPSQCQRPATCPLLSPKSCRQCQHQLVAGASAPCCQLYWTFHLVCLAQGRFMIGGSTAVWPKSTWVRICWPKSTCCWPWWWWWWWWWWCLCLSTPSGWCPSCPLPWCSWWWCCSPSVVVFSSVDFLHFSSCSELCNDQRKRAKMKIFLHS